jgi:hypothetical protein
MIPCMVCGNEITPGSTICRFCGNSQPVSAERVASVREFRQKTINLELGRPIVATALARLEREIEAARAAGVQVMTIIHGYGSSGKGGVIREECRKTLAYLQSIGRISSCIPGEEFHRKAGPTRSLLRRYPELAGDAKLGRNNPGITLVVF